MLTGFFCCVCIIASAMRIGSPDKLGGESSFIRQ